MKNFNFVSTLALAGLAATLFSAPSAHASLIPSLASVTPTSGNNFIFSYNAMVSADESLNPAATNGVSCPGANNMSAQCNPTGTFFTIYDFNGFVSVSSMPAGWYATNNNTGVTPSTVNGPSIDDPNIMNVTFFYTGAVVNGPVTITGFNIISNLGGQKGGQFSSQSTLTANGKSDQVVGSVSTPAAATPEPASFLLIGAGLMAFAGVRRFTHK